jgi:hypothetical protein
MMSNQHPVETCDCESCGAEDAVILSQGCCTRCEAGPIDAICFEGGYNCTECRRDRTISHVAQESHCV